MEPLYSILLSNQDYAEYKGKIKQWLLKGIKVIWFNQNADEVAELKAENRPFTKIFMLQAYAVTFADISCIIDGKVYFSFRRAW